MKSNLYVQCLKRCEVLESLDFEQWRVTLQIVLSFIFLKVLQNTRQKANLKLEKETPPQDIDYHKTLEKLKRNNLNQSKVNIGIRHIFFREDYNLPYDAILKFSIDLDALTHSSKSNSIFSISS